MSDYLQKIVYLTDSQYATLAGGGTVGSLTGLNDNYIYITDGKVSLSDFDDSLILPVNKGGTGASSWASGKILVGNGSSTFTTIDKATANTANTLVQRDGSGNFSAGTITAALSGNATTATTATNLSTKPTLAASGNSITVTAGGKTSDAFTVPYATSAGSVAWTNVSSKPIEFITNTSSLTTNGWKTLGGTTGGKKIAISYNNAAADWNSSQYSASLVFGCNDTKGLLDCSHNTPIVTFGGSYNANCTDDNPTWYFKIKGTSGKTYTFPTDTKTLCATDGSNASGTWGISITGSSASCTGNANTATTASKLSNTSAIGSDVNPVYFTSNGVPQATATEMVRAFTNSNYTDLNTCYDSGLYSLPGGAVTNYPAGGAAYATLLTVAYRKPSGNTKPDYAWQMGNFAQDSDKMWYRTSTPNAWRSWRQIVSIATNTGVGGSTTPVYVDANGSVQSCTSYANATVGNATKVAAKLAATTKTYLLGTSTTITGTAANVDLIGDTGIYATTTAGELSAVRHSFNVSGTEKAYITYNSTDNSLDFVFV